MSEKEMRTHLLIKSKLFPECHQDADNKWERSVNQESLIQKWMQRTEPEQPERVLEKDAASSAA